MTMHSAEINLISFDVQDVIATSGGPFYLSFDSNKKSIDTLTGADSNRSKNAEIMFYDEEGRGGKFFTLYSAAYQDNGGTDRYTVEVLAYINEPEGTKIDYSFDSILNWLRTTEAYPAQ